MTPPFLGMTSPFKSHGWSLFVKVKSHVTALNPIKTHCITWNHIKSHWIPCNHINYHWIPCKHIKTHWIPLNHIESHWIPLNLPLSYHYTHVMNGQELRWTLLRFLSSSARPACPVSAVGLNAALRREHLRRDPWEQWKINAGWVGDFRKMGDTWWKHGVLMCLMCFYLGFQQENWW